MSAVPGERVFDVVLFGYRNDVAGARTLAFLKEWGAAEGSPIPIDAHTSLPQRLFTGLEKERAEELRRQLEQLGAQVALLDSRTASLVPVVDDATAASPTRALRLTLLLGLLAAALVLLRWQTAPQRAPVHPAVAPANAPLEPLRSQAELTNEPAAVTFNAEAIQLASAERFAEAVDRLQMALRVAPQHPILQRNLQTVLLNWGVAELTAGHVDDAADHLRRAAELGEERGEILRALGVVYLRQERYADAAAALERALKLEPADRDAMVTLAQIYLKQDKRPEALELLQRAKERGASGPDLERMLQQLSREVDTEWDFVQLESRHFRISFGDGEDRRTVRLILDTLEGVYEDVGAKLNHYPDEPTAVVLYTQRDFHTVTQTPDWAGGAFDGRIKIPVRGLDPEDAELVRVLRHEYAHSVVAQLADGRCPVWLNEGVAVWAEESQDGDHEPWAERKIAEQGFYPLDELNQSFAHLSSQRAEGAYAESYLAVRNLIDGYGPAKLVRLLTALATARDFNAAFASVYPGDLALFQRNLLRQISG